MGQGVFFYLVGSEIAGSSRYAVTAELLDSGGEHRIFSLGSWTPSVGLVEGGGYIYLAAVKNRLLPTQVQF